MQTRSPRALILALTLLPGLAHAAPITVSWTGMTYLVDEPLSPDFRATRPVSGSFQIETDIADTNPDPERGEYPAAVSALSFDFNGYTNTGSAPGLLTIINGGGLNLDGLVVHASVTGPSVRGLDLMEFDLEIVDFSQSVFSDDSIPSSLDVSNFPDNLVRLTFTNQYIVQGNLTTLTSVPEPGTAMLFSLGTLPLAALRRRRALSAL